MSNAQLINHNNEFYLELGKLKTEHTAFLCKSFEQLPPSDYKDGKFRLRRFSHFKFKNNQLTHLPKKGFLQSVEFNQFQGDIERQYEEIEKEVIQSPAFLEMFQHFKSIANVNDNADIDVHQIRISSNSGEKRPVTPEGVHQDGYKHIGIFSIQRKHIKEGGDLCIHDSKQNKPFIQYSFDHGEFIVLNDKRFWHSATDIVAEDQHNGIMDVFVLTA